MKRVHYGCTMMCIVWFGEMRFIYFVVPYWVNQMDAFIMVEILAYMDVAVECCVTA